MAKYFLIGETHGTNEAPEACWKIMNEKNIQNLALEFSHRYQRQIDEFMRGKRDIHHLSVFCNPLPHDGRASAAVKRLLIRAKKKAKNVYFVDSEARSIENREQAMANNLMRIRGSVAFLCGDAHAAKKAYNVSLLYRMMFRIFSCFSSKYPPKLDRVIIPCGARLPRRSIVSYRVVAMNGGRFYNFGMKTAKRYRVSSKFTSSLPAVVVSPDTRYDFVYVVKRFTPASVS